MKNIVLVAVVVASLVVFGCTQILPPSSSGRDFPGENVSRIVRGKTTDKDLIQMLGEPLSKTVISETEKSWIYTYTSGTATVVRRLTSVETKYEGNAKTLDILLKNGVVTNFTFTERLVIH
jgi:outer membrane lipoprotein-sorting protein